MPRAVRNVYIRCLWFQPWNFCYIHNTQRYFPNYISTGGGVAMRVGGCTCPQSNVQKDEMEGKDEGKGKKNVRWYKEIFCSKMLFNDYIICQCNRLWYWENLDHDFILCIKTVIREWRLCTQLCVRASTESNDRGNSIFVKRIETFVLSAI